jgi:hypothetical protein
MTGFVFQVIEAFVISDGFDGETVLAGVRVDTGDLAVGDGLWVPVSSGERVLVRVAAFPLMSFTDRDWQAVPVEGVSADHVAVGGIAADSQVASARAADSVRVSRSGAVRRMGSTSGGWWGGCEGDFYGTPRNSGQRVWVALDPASVGVSGGSVGWWLLVGRVCRRASGGRVCRVPLPSR